jgi:glycosidase
MVTHLKHSRFIRYAYVALFAICLVSAGRHARAAAQTDGTTAFSQALTIIKIDPPNWFATLPKPMLLVRGTGLTCAAFSVSDAALTVERSETSANGHWAQVFLSGSPASAETVTLRAACPGGAEVQQSYTFAARRALSSGIAGFSSRDVIYLIVTDRFADGDPNNDGPLAHDAQSSPAAAAERAKLRGWHGGDLRGITQHLDYLQQLGVTTVWTTPVYQNHGPEAFHGYHTTDYYSVDEHYGTLADLQTLVQSLHARHMKLILDTVPNHVGPFHPWVLDEPSPDWFHGTLAHHIAGETDFSALIDPHASPASRVPTLDGWFVDALPDMNTNSPAVALYLRQNAVWWIEETGADGLRIDTFPYVDRAFWHAYMDELSHLYPHLTEVGEVSTEDPEINSAFAGGVTRAGVDTGLYTPFDYPFYHAMRDVFAGTAPFTRLTRTLTSDELYPHPGRLVSFLGNHDQARLAEDVPDPALRALAYTVLLTTRGTPQLYYGDELAMRGGNDPNNRHDFPGGFLPTEPGAFVADGRTPPQQAEFSIIQRLLALRQSQPALETGTEQILHAGNDTLVYLRTLVGEPTQQVLVAVNKSGAAQTVSIDLTGTAAADVRHVSPLMGSSAVTISSGKLTITLAPKSALIASLG